MRPNVKQAAITENTENMRLASEARPTCRYREI